MSEVRAVGDELWLLEQRLRRILGSGWRNASADLAALEAEVADLEAAGLGALAERVRAVARASSAGEALGAVAVAAAACRMLVTRLPGDAPHGEWAQPTRRKTSVGTERLLPVARQLLGEQEMWVCARLRGAATTGLVLIEPQALPDEVETVAAGVKGIAARLGFGGRNASTAPRIWLRRQLDGALRWRARHPLGATGELQVCAGDDLTWRKSDEADPTNQFRELFASGKIIDGMPVVGWGGALQLKELRTEAAGDYAWCDTSAAEAFRGYGIGSVWAIAWVPKGLVAPLAIVTPPGLLQPARLVHLVPGLPVDVLAD